MKTWKGVKVRGFQTWICWISPYSTRMAMGKVRTVSKCYLSPEDWPDFPFSSNQLCSLPPSNVRTSLLVFLLGHLTELTLCESQSCSWLPPPSHVEDQRGYPVIPNASIFLCNILNDLIQDLIISYTGNYKNPVTGLPASSLASLPHLSTS